MKQFCTIFITKNGDFDWLFVVIVMWKKNWSGKKVGAVKIKINI